MELKHNKITYKVSCVLVLIVPYGIETPKDRYGNPDKNVLIVPYGIETFKR